VTTFTPSLWGGEEVTYLVMGELTDARHIRLVDWLTTAPKLREPSTFKELAAELGVSDRTLRDWKQRPEVRSQWEKRAVEVAGDPERTQRILDALYAAATDPEARDRVQAAKAWADMTGAIKPPAKETVALTKDTIKQITDADLDRLIAETAMQMKQEREAK
jgi:hypothetical protein